MSTEINDGGPAFPVPEIHDQTPPYRHLLAEQGMSLRDYFAAKAMQGFILNNWVVTDPGARGLLVRTSYEMADAMLAAREAA